MAAEAQAVAQAMAEILVAGLAGVVVDRFAWQAGMRGRHGFALRLVHDVEQALHFVGGLADNERARDG